MSQRQRRLQEKRRRHGRDRRRSTGRQLAAGAGVTVGATLLIGGSAQAATFTVDSLADPTEPDHTTLRDAITSAEIPANAGSTIVFASGLSGTITIGSELPAITQATTIQGPGAGQVAISGNDATRIMYIQGPADGFPVTVSGLTLRNGLAQMPPGPRNGAAIFIENANLTVADSILTGNRALGSGPEDGYGGAICICSDVGNLTVRDSTFSGNVAGGSGGAIYDDNSPVTIISSTFTGNRAHFRGGAGSFSSPEGPVAIQNSTFTGNTQTATGGADYGGGAVFSYVGGITITSSTVSGNSGSRGGGVNLDSTGPQTDLLHNTIVANNSASEAGPDLFGAFDSAFSLVRDTAGASINQSVPGSSVFGADPQLGALASNGGPTQTMKPALTSPVVDKGAGFGLGSDQRGAARPIEIPTIPNSTTPGVDGNDIGAVELQLSDVPPAAPAPPVTTKKKKCKKKKHKRSAESAKKKKCKKKKKR